MPSVTESTPRFPGRELTRPAAIDDAEWKNILEDRLEALHREQTALELELREVKNQLSSNKHDKNSAYCIHGRQPSN